MINLPTRYQKVLEIFSAGGMSDTILCEDSNLQRKVVIKSLKPGIAAHRLLDELSALSAIRSRYVVQVLDVIVDGGLPVGFVEEYLPGKALEPLVTATASVRDALHALYPIAAGICEIHDHDRVHRDIKPDNMRYDSDGQLKIFDFGLAKLSTSAGTSALYYSDGYCAPEAFKKTPAGLHAVDKALDVYAFGCVAIWLLNDGKLFPEMMGFTPSLPLGFDFLSLQVKVDPVTASLLLRCLSSNASLRPTMGECRDHIAGELLRDRHKMVLTSRNHQYVLDKVQRSATIGGGGSSITVGYDGIYFLVRAVVGPVAINNASAVVGQRLSGSSVIVLGALGSSRISVACDVSHPEVTL